MIQEKRFLIKSVYSYYDDFDIQDVCICETKELAENLVKVFQEKIYTFKNIYGYILYLETEDNEDFISTFEEENIILNSVSNIVQIFLEDYQFESIKAELEQGEYYTEKTNYLEFMARHSNKDTIIKKYCNHYNSSLYIEELDYIK